MVFEEVDEQLEDMLHELKGNAEEFISRRINHIGFAKTIFFLCVKARTEDFIYSRDLSSFRGITRQGSNLILGDLVNVKLLKKINKVGNISEFWFMKDDYSGMPLINRYFNQCCRTLGIKGKITLEDNMKTEIRNKENGIY